MPNEEIRKKIAEIICSKYHGIAPKIPCTNCFITADQILALFPTAPKEERLLSEAEIVEYCKQEKLGECGQLAVGKTYKRADDKPFSFNTATGIFIGMTPNGFPRFSLNEKGRECFMNYEPTLENFIEVEPIKPLSPKIEELVVDPAYFGENQARLIQQFGDKINEIIRNANKE